MAAKIVKTTTRANALAPTPAWILAKFPKAITATRMDIMKTSTMDQRPIISIIRYITVRCTGLHLHLYLTDNSKTVSPSILSSGTKIDAMNTIKASGHIPAFIRATTPEAIVSGSPLPKIVTVIIGYTLAGIYRIIEVIRKAQVRAMESCFRRCMVAPHRGQTATEP